MERGDIYIVSPDPDSEQAREEARTVMVVSPAAFNEATGRPIVLPVTSDRSCARTRGFAVPLGGAATRTTGVIRCDQPSAIDMEARGGRKIESVPAGIIDEVIARLATIWG